MAWLTLILFLGSLLGQWTFGWYAYVEEQNAHQQPIQVSDYVAASWISVRVARWAGLPYYDAKMKTVSDREAIHYTSARQSRPHKFRMLQVFVGRPLRKFYLSHQLRLKPSAILHLFLC